MQAVLGIDAAWTERQPSGVALIEGDQNLWRIVCLAPSYDAFVAYSQGVPVDWKAPNFRGSRPDITALIKSAKDMITTGLSVVAIDMPVATVPFDSRRAADTAISKAFGSRGCSTHSPSTTRPGRLGRSIMSQLNAEGFPLATVSSPRPSARCTIEVYPHPAVLSLLRQDYRVPYKVSRSSRYWPNTSIAERVSMLLTEFHRINAALRAVLGTEPIVLPPSRGVATLAALKRYEDALDALICAWVGVEFLEGAVSAFGDGSSTIWVPR